MTEGLRQPLEKYIKTALETTVPGKVDEGDLHNQLNGKKTPDITPAGPVFGQLAVPTDALVHPAAAALKRRHLLQQGGRTAELIAAENAEVQKINSLATSGEVFRAPTPPVRRRA